MKKLGRSILFILGVVILLLGIGLGFFPTWASSESGQRTLVGWINAWSRGSFSIEKLELSWFGSQRFEHVLYQDSQGETIFKVRNLETDTPLFNLLFSRRSFNRTLLQDPYLRLQSDEEKTSTSFSKKRKSSASSQDFALPNFRGPLQVENGTLVLEPTDSLPVTLKDMNIAVDPNEKQLQIKANSIQGSLNGSIEVTANLEQPLRIQANGAHLPTAILDFFEGSDKVSKAIGPEISFSIAATAQEKRTFTLKAQLEAPQLKGYLEGRSDGTYFYVGQNTTLDYTLTPQFFKYLLEEEQRGNWELASKTLIRAEIEEGVFPLQMESPSWKQIQLKGKMTIDRAELTHKRLGTYSLNRTDLLLQTQDTLNAQFHAEIQGKEASKVQGELAFVSSETFSFKVECLEFPVTLLTLASTQLEKNARQLLGPHFDLNAEGNVNRQKLKGEITLKSNELAAKVQLTGKLDSFKFSTEGEKKLTGKTAELMGPALSFNITGNAHERGGSLIFPLLRGQLTNSNFDLNFKGSFGEAGKPLSPNTLKLIAKCIIHELPIEEKGLNGGVCTLEVDGPNNRLIGEVSAGESEATVSINQLIQEGEIDFSKAQITFETHLKHFPTAALSPFLPSQIQLPMLVGKTITVNSFGHYFPNQTPRLKLKLDAKATGFAANLSVEIDEGLVVTQQTPATIRWELTPQRYAALMEMLSLEETKEPTFTLVKPTTFDLEIQQFTCPHVPPKEIKSFLCQSGFTGKMHLGLSFFKNKQTGESIAIEEVSGLVSGERFADGIDLDIKGKILAANVPNSENSGFGFQGSLLNFWTESGELATEHLTLKGVLTLDLIPVPQLIGILPIDQETRNVVQAVLGELLNARIAGEIVRGSGPLTLDIQSSNFKAIVPLQLQPHHFYLRDYVNAEITLTEAVNATLLRDITPLLVSGAYSENPLKLTIGPEGFMVPIRPYSLEGVKIGAATLDIGKISIRNGGQIQKLMSFLKVGDITPEGWMSAWFTPIYIHLEKGVATYKRVDALLANSAHIALWGSINLITDEVRMTLGIAAPTLQQRFEINGLSRTEMFQVKMRGTTHKLELDWSAASTRIGYLIARSAGGGLGQIVGGILEQFFKELGEEKAPPPTTQPFPWESKPN